MTGARGGNRGSGDGALGNHLDRGGLPSTLIEVVQEAGREHCRQPPVPGTVEDNGDHWISIIGSNWVVSTQLETSSAIFHFPPGGGQQEGAKLWVGEGFGSSLHTLPKR